MRHCQSTPSTGKASRILATLLFLLPGVGWGQEASVTATVSQIGEAFVVDVTTVVAVPLNRAWEVLTDFDHMASFMTNLKSSKVIRRSGNTWLVRQDGVAHYGPLSLAFESEREIRLEPKQRILAKSLSGTAKRMESEALLTSGNDGLRIKYHAEIVPNSGLARMFGATIVRHEIEEQFRELSAEMLRRHEQGD